jgi:hypothetical protein
MDLGSCREVIKHGQTGFLVNNVIEAVEALNEFLKSIVVPAATVSSNTFRSRLWWTDTNESTR